MALPTRWRSFLSKYSYQIIGFILTINWILLVIDRIQYGITYNLFWISHLALLLAIIGFFLGSDLLLSGALISILVVHGFWIIDFIGMVLTGSSPFGYTSYIMLLTPYRRLITAHHLYLLPLLVITVWKRKKINPRGWVVASALFLIATSMALAYPVAYNLNCAHFACPTAIKIVPLLGILTKTYHLAYFIFLNLIVSVFVFFIPNIILSKMFQMRR